MSLRISLETTERGRVIHVSGDLIGQAVETLREQLTELRLTARTLDLSELRFIDTSGARVLAEAERAGVQLEAASPYVELMIERNREIESGSASATSTDDEQQGSPDRGLPTTGRA